MVEDRIYRSREAGRDFTFDTEVAAVFDNMLDRSVPHYREVLREEAVLLAGTLRGGDLVYDLGCSTGNGLLAVAAALSGRDIRYIGIDTSAAMLDRAREHSRAFTYGDSIDFIEGDAGEMPLKTCGAVLCNYTLQFIRPPRRVAFIKRVFDALRPGGILLLAEKTVEHDPLLNRLFIEQGHDFKREHGYSDLEIARKREELENVLIPFSIEENLQLLRGAGFTHAASFFQWFNWSAFIAVKGERPDED